MVPSSAHFTCRRGSRPIRCLIAKFSMRRCQTYRYTRDLVACARHLDITIRNTWAQAFHLTPPDAYRAQCFCRGYYNVDRSWIGCKKYREKFFSVHDFLMIISYMRLMVYCGEKTSTSLTLSRPRIGYGFGWPTSRASSCTFSTKNCFTFGFWASVLPIKPFFSTQ